jgi:Na+-transporting methylmalonyl-CoA/oxaloacetate decarboxylase gamma subunit
VSLVVVLLLVAVLLAVLLVAVLLAVLLALLVAVPLLHQLQRPAVVQRASELAAPLHRSPPRPSPRWVAVGQRPRTVAVAVAVAAARWRCPW